MTNHRAILKAIPAVLLVCASGFAAAADTQNLTVSGTVSGVCRFSSLAQTLSFGGAIDPNAAGPINGAGAAVKYKCTKGTTATGVTAGNGLNFSGSRRMGNGADFIPYTLTISDDLQVGLGFGAGNDLDLTVAGQIVKADYENVSAGAYSDTVLLTLTP
jgi:spore coat protein U-like protein